MGDPRDELDIRHIVARIAHHSDMGSLDDYGAQFAEDASWDMPGMPSKRGRIEIQEAGAARRAEGLTGPGSRTARCDDRRGDRGRRPWTATARWPSRTGGSTPTRPPRRCCSMGHYRDTFRRDPDGRRLVRRLVTSG
jgi:hypothetical protein